MAPQFEDVGYALVPGLFSAEECSMLSRNCERTNSRRVGSRNLLQNTWCQDAALRIKRHDVIARFLPYEASCVQCTLFRKDSENNWAVAFHQDLSIPVRERISDPACAGWSQKEGVLFVQPPVEILK